MLWLLLMVQGFFLSGSASEKACMDDKGSCVQAVRESLTPYVVKDYAYLFEMPGFTKIFGRCISNYMRDMSKMQMP